MAAERVNLVIWATVMGVFKDEDLLEKVYSALEAFRQRVCDAFFKLVVVVHGQGQFIARRCAVRMYGIIVAVHKSWPRTTMKFRRFPFVLADSLSKSGTPIYSEVCTATCSLSYHVPRDVAQRRLSGNRVYGPSELKATSTVRKFASRPRIWLRPTTRTV